MDVPNLVLDNENYFFIQIDGANQAMDETNENEEGNDLAVELIPNENGENDKERNQVSGLVENLLIIVPYLHRQLIERFPLLQGVS